METPLYTSSVTEVNGGKTGNVSYIWTASPTMIVDVRASATYTPNLSGTSHGAGFTNDFLP